MYSLLVMTISGSIIALLLMCLRYTVLRKMPSTVYYYAWLLVLLRFALPLPGLIPAMGETTADMTASEVPAAYSEIYVQENTDHVSETGHSEVVKSDTPEAKGTQIALDASETQDLTVSETAPKAMPAIDWKSPALWLSVWAAGAFVSMGITVISYFHFSLSLKKKLMEPDSFTKAVYASIPGRKPALYFSDSARTPMMLGVFRPKIVLPRREYNEELLLNILRHELTHYRRFDTLYKWAAAAVLSLHWFNPVAWVIRREFNRACELSCDEMLLRSMDKDEKQSYGNSLLLMAASSPLPSAVVATSFATEKRNLKERLVQIMSYKKSGTRLLAAVLAITLLTGCGVAAGPVSAKATEKQQESAASKPEAGTKEEGVVRVKNIDELLAAIAPHTVIEMAEGVYDLSTASNYGKDSESDYYSWNLECADDTNDVSAELVIRDVKDLTIRGAGMGKTTIEAVPRYANVIDFRGCSKITVSDLTAGHTEKPGFCSGGVLLFENCNDVNVEKCGLYGCGTIGVRGLSSEKLNVTDCDIYECSDGAIDATYCEDVFVSGCDIHDHGTRNDSYSPYCLFTADFGTRFTVYNCKIHDNMAEGLLYTCGTENVIFISNEVTENTFISNAFYFEQYGAAIDGCQFDGNNCIHWYKSDARIKAADTNGNMLEDDQFTSMKLRDIDPETVIPKTVAVPTLEAKDVPPGTEVNVTTVDEFLEAIGPDRIIVLDGTNFDLSKAENYGGIGTEFYSWEDTYDGFQLVIHDVDNLVIKAKDPDPSATTLEALPRYANVLFFRNCYYITVEGFTAGHTKEKGTCAGGVLYFSECEKITVEKMRLYGCGDMGIDTFMCSDIDVIETEIYECTSGAVFFYETKGINLQDCNIHDVPTPALTFTACKNMTWDGQKLEGDELRYDVKTDGTLIPLKDI
ncbi:MAG: right-handed parallel beta-helix repeat-containing protein [Clostridiales bacterium]|nr:right-handed parallel beta-helix repeat-containing protein [Clostridiales bacterium]